jgi:hypothetical protein
MRSTGEFLVPHLNGALYSQKPPLLFWLINAGWLATGVHAWSARAMTLACSLATLVLVARLTQRVTGSESAARASAVFLLGMLYFATFANAIMFDVLLATCALIGWWAGGRLFLAITWTALAVWMIVTPLAGAASFVALSKGWALLLVASFGVASIMSPHRPFFPRALSAIGLSFAVGLGIVLFAPNRPAAVQRSVRTEYTRRAGGRLESSGLPYPFFAARRSRSATMPASRFVRMSRPKPCFKVIAALGTLYWMNGLPPSASIFSVSSEVLW